MSWQQDAKKLITEFGPEAVDRLRAILPSESTIREAREALGRLVGIETPAAPKPRTASKPRTAPKTQKAEKPTTAPPSLAVPKKTVKAYKLFKTKKDKPGELYPLFVDANTPVPQDQWVPATAGQLTETGKVKSSIGPLAYRPGWHAGEYPMATHIGGKSDPSLKAPDYRPDDQVWAEVEMPDDVDWQSIALDRAERNKAGSIIPRTAHITDQVPYGGHYRYKTNPNMTGDWLIGGDMRVNRVLNPEEVAAINSAAGVADLPPLRVAKINRYEDPASDVVGDWNWRPLSDVYSDLGGISELPPQVLPFGQFMLEKAAQAEGAGLDPRDLLKAYGITRSSIQRQARPLATAERGGLNLEHLGLDEVRPEGAFAEWLGTDAGQAYLDAAQRGQVREDAIADLQTKFAPFGFQNTLADDLAWGAQNLPQYAPQISDMIAAAKAGDVEGLGDPALWTDFIRDKVRGVDAAKAGFVGSMLGRGDLPTLDARQIILQTGEPTSAAQAFLRRRGGLGSIEGVNRLTGRMRALDLAVPEELMPFYQHLTHHAVWDKAGDDITTHADLMNAMRNYSEGGFAVKKGHC